MEEQVIPQPVEHAQSSRIVWIVITAVVITAIVVGVVVYAWQKSISQSMEQSLQQQIIALQNQIKNLQQNIQPVAATPEVTQEQDQPTSEIADWEKYENKTYGFEFNYPPDSTIETRDDLNYQYIRLQNYIPTDDPSGLDAGEYYLEIFIFDHEKGHEFSESESCAQSVVDGKKVEVGVASGYRGHGQEGGDAGGIRFALCVERPEVDFYIQGTENNPNAPLVNPILDSFEFTK